MKKAGFILLTIAGFIAFIVSIATTKEIIFVSFLILAAIAFIIGSFISAKTSKQDDERVEQLENNSLNAVYYKVLDENVKLPAEIIEKLNNKNEEYKD